MTLEIGIFDATTNENIVREMTDDEKAIRMAEIADWEKERAEKLAQVAAIEAAKIDAVTKLEELGIDPKALGL
jgi:hypothetical protein